MASANNDSSSSDEDSCSYYSGQASRFKLTKQALYPTGRIKLVDKPLQSKKVRKEPEEPSSSESDSDGSDDSTSPTKKRKTATLEEEKDFSNEKQVETFDELGEYMNLSPDISMIEETRKIDSPVYNYQEEYQEEDLIEEPPISDPFFDTEELMKNANPNEKITIKVRFASNIKRMELTRADYFKSLIQVLSVEAGVDPSNISLYLHNKLLDPYDSLKTVHIGIADIIDASITRELIVPSNANMLKFKVQTQNRSSEVFISIRKEDPMLVLMEKYATQTANDLTKLKFIFDGEILQDDDTPMSLDLEGGECIDVYLK